MDINLDRAVQAARRREVVRRPPAAVPEVLWGVFVCYEQNRNAVVGGGGVDADSRRREVFGGGFGERLLEGADQVGIGRFEGVLLSAGCGLPLVRSCRYGSKWAAG